MIVCELFIFVMSSLFLYNKDAGIDLSSSGGITPNFGGKSDGNGEREIVEVKHYKVLVI